MDLPWSDSIGRNSTKKPLSNFINYWIIGSFNVIPLTNRVSGTLWLCKCQKHTPSSFCCRILYLLTEPSQLRESARNDELVHCFQHFNEMKMSVIQTLYCLAVVKIHQHDLFVAVPWRNGVWWCEREISSLVVVNFAFMQIQSKKKQINNNIIIWYLSRFLYTFFLLLVLLCRSRIPVCTFGEIHCKGFSLLYMHIFFIFWGDEKHYTCCCVRLLCSYREFGSLSQKEYYYHIFSINFTYSNRFSCFSFSLFLSIFLSFSLALFLSHFPPFRFVCMSFVYSRVSRYLLLIYLNTCNSSSSGSDIKSTVGGGAFSQCFFSSLSWNFTWHTAFLY